MIANVPVLGVSWQCETIPRRLWRTWWQTRQLFRPSAHPTSCRRCSPRSPCRPCRGCRACTRTRLIINGSTSGRGLVWVSLSPLSIHVLLKTKIVSSFSFTTLSTTSYIGGEIFWQKRVKKSSWQKKVKLLTNAKVFLELGMLAGIVLLEKG